MYDLVIRDGKEIMYIISDLAIHYDQQLPNIGCLVQDSIGVKRELAKLFAKIMPIMNHHICTSFRISKELYGGVTYKLGETGQGNFVSSTICRDTS